MDEAFRLFEKAARSSIAKAKPEPTTEVLHPFDVRNIHPALPTKVKSLFDGYFAEATFTAFKFLDKAVAKHSSIKETGYKLMMAAFDESSPKIRLTGLSDSSEIDEQKGYRFMFAGAVQAIRNPRGHEIDTQDDLDVCLDHLAFASLLLRRLESAGISV